MSLTHSMSFTLFMFYILYVFKFLLEISLLLASTISHTPPLLGNDSVIRRNRQCTMNAPLQPAQAYSQGLALSPCSAFLWVLTRCCFPEPSITCYALQELGCPLTKPPSSLQLLTYSLWTCTAVCILFLAGLVSPKPWSCLSLKPHFNVTLMR